MAFLREHGLIHEVLGRRVVRMAEVHQAIAEAPRADRVPPAARCAPVAGAESAAMTRKSIKTFRIGAVAVSPMKSRGRRGDRAYWRARRQQETIWCGWGTPAEAYEQVQAALVVADIAVENKRRRRSSATVAEVLAEWLDYEQSAELVRSSTLEGYRRHVRHLTEVVGHVAVHAITTDTLERYIGERKRAKVNRRTAAFEFRYLNRAIRWAAETGRIDPVAQLPRIRPGKAEARQEPEPPPIESIRLVLKALGEMESQWVRVIVELALHTGARIGELCHLKVSDIDLTLGAETMSVPDVEGCKTGGRPIPLVPAAARLVRDWLDLRGREKLRRRPSKAFAHYFTGRSPVGARNTIAESLRDKPDWSKIPGQQWAMGDLRKRMVTELYGSGADPGVAGKIVGHSPLTALKHYNRPSMTARREALAALRIGEVANLANVVPMKRKGE